eukprot:5103308-Pleurochrysis_carterae.AAC.1
MAYNVCYKHFVARMRIIQSVLQGVMPYLVTRMEILQCVLQSVMPYNVDYKHACSPNGDPTTRVTSVTPYNEYYTHA